MTYNYQEVSIPDTIEKKTLTKQELWKLHHTAINCLTTIPIFGKNSIVCDDDFYEASSGEMEKGYCISQVQYKCGNDYRNAVFYTDSLNFSVFVGVVIPGESTYYSVNATTNSTFDFYHIESKRKIDTLRSKIFLMEDIQKSKLLQVCK